MAKYISLFVSLLFLVSSAYAASPKYLWGQATSPEYVVGFRLQGNRITKFGATIPLQCTTTDGVSYSATDDINQFTSPALTVRRSRVRANFSITASSTRNLQVHVEIHFFNSKKAEVALSVQSHDEGEDCAIVTVFERVKRGKKVP